jgi:mitogen-activated protein kinase kinase
MIDCPEEGVVWSEAVQDFLALWRVPRFLVLLDGRLSCSPSIHHSLIRSPQERPYPRDLLNHPWILESERRNLNLAKWVAAVCEW